MKNEETLIQTDNVRVRLIELQPGASTPYHSHTEVTDTMFGVSGETLVHMRAPDEEIRLAPGDRCTVETGRVHRVANALEDAPSKYLLIQGVGRYDFIEAGHPS